MRKSLWFFGLLYILVALADGALALFTYLVLGPESALFAVVKLFYQLGGVVLSGLTLLGWPLVLSGLLRPKRSWIPLFAFCFSTKFLMGLPLTAALFSALDTVSVFAHGGDIPFLLKHVSWFSGLYLTTSLIQALLSLWALVAFALLPKGREFYFKKSEQEIFKGKQFMGLGALNALILLLGIPLYLAVNVLWTVRNGTAHFLDLDTKYLYAESRTYELKEKKVILVPMMHIGEKAFYKKVMKQFDAPSTLMLTEGIQDTKGLIKNKEAYDKVSKAIGVGSQAQEFQKSKGSQLKILNADINTSQFSKETISFINYSFALYSSKKAGLWSQQKQQFNDAKFVQKFLGEILTLRNEVLMKAFDKNLKNFTQVVIPWGALHMPEIEKALYKRGFEQKAKKRFVLLDLSKLGKKFAKNTAKASAEKPKINKK